LNDSDWKRLYSAINDQSSPIKENLMQRPGLKIATGLLVVAMFSGAFASAREAPLAGNWKLLNVSTGNEQVVALFQVEEVDGRLEAKALAAPLLGGKASVENFKAEPKTIQFDIKTPTSVFNVKLYAGDGDAKTIRGSISFNNQLLLAQLTKTDDTTLTTKEAAGQTEQGKALLEAGSLVDVKERQKALKELIEKYGDKPVAYPAHQMLLRGLVKEGAEDSTQRTAAEQLLKLAAPYGPEVEQHTLVTIAQTLVRAAKVSPLAVEFSRKASKAQTDDSVGTTRTLKVLAAALRRTGANDELKTVEARLDKIETALDEAFTKNAVPFKPAAFEGRRGESQRVAVVELFTGAYCPPCVASDVAFDAVLEAYKPTDVILLQYHVHIPAPDRLTNADSEARQKYYSVNSTPSAFVNGTRTKGLGGPKEASERSYTSLHKDIDAAVEKEAAAALTLTADRKDDKVQFVAEVSELKKPGAKVRLRFVLVEDVVRYPGSNGQRLHHHVVRALPGGADGFALEEAKTKQTVSVDLGDLTKKLDEYMNDFNKGERPFRDDDYPLNLKHLKVVALIQDDDSKEILQAVQIDVPERK
jgi:hypothetical protein